MGWQGFTKHVCKRLGPIFRKRLEFPALTKLGDFALNQQRVAPYPNPHIGRVARTTCFEARSLVIVINRAPYLRSSEVSSNSYSSGIA